MKRRTNIIFSKFYWKISAIFLMVLLVFATISLYISVNSANQYSLEVNQKLNRDLAKNMVSMIQPFLKNGEVNEAAIEDIVHSMMVINPSVEVYILNPEGKILSYVAPEKVVKLKKVSLSPVKQFLNDKAEEKIVYGNDPRNPDETKIFSAAPIIENNSLAGYLYIVLASQEYVSAAHMLLESYILKLSTRSIILILIVTTIVGLLAIWFITKKLNVIINGIQSFKSGNLKARIPVQSEEELDQVAQTFNEMADTIEKNIKELKGMDRLRKELISNVSHDLRSPVASIQGYAETLMLKEGKLSKEENKEYLSIIVKSCNKLKKLVGDLFELAKLESSQIKPETEPFSIAELVHDVANKYRLDSQKKGISINTVLSKDIPLVEADISLIDRVLQNLLDNAIKFCKEGDYINIEIDLENPEAVQVKIADSGRGIPQENLPHIFERYYRDPERSNKGAESSGLGLAIVKKIMDLHGTEIEVQSQLHKGTTFSFSLPTTKV